MNNNVATIEKIRQAVRCLRNALEAKGKDGESYNVAFGISFSPSKNLDADGLIEAVTKNKAVSKNLVYGFQAGLKKEPLRDTDKASAIAALSAFDAELAELPQDVGALMVLELTVSNPHEQEIIQDAQKSINAIAEVPATPLLKKA